MTLSIRIKKRKSSKHNKFNRIRTSLKTIHKENVDVGYFVSQGIHTSGYSFPVLMAIHEFGIGYTPRPAMTIGAISYKNDLVKTSQQVKVWGASLTRSSERANQMLLENIGADLQRKVRFIFGNPSKLPVTNNPTPLIKSSELVSHLARRNSIDNIVRMI